MSPQTPPFPEASRNSPPPQSHDATPHSRPPGAPPEPPEVAALLARSNRLGSDPRNTNYAGGNTSAKGTATDPVTGQPAELLWVKGSGAATSARSPPAGSPCSAWTGSAR